MGRYRERTLVWWRASRVFWKIHRVASQHPYEGCKADAALALEQGPGKVLLPYLLHLSASSGRDTLIGELADLCSVDTDTQLPLEPAQGKPKAKSSSSRAGGSASTSLAADLMNSLWGSKQLDGLRLRYALATWCAVSRAPAVAHLWLKGLTPGSRQDIASAGTVGTRPSRASWTFSRGISATLSCAGRQHPRLPTSLLPPLHLGTGTLFIYLCDRSNRCPTPSPCPVSKRT
jgi:hypothetical protein